ncbi:MAG: hypothetical protein KGJ98_05050 [Chloroflexota bacterium]|nr:hypothetical protein [Chloroflexota bacterium]MDE3101585.1 hypothetical protein [Chloroflexota bacterium]
MCDGAGGGESLLPYARYIVSEPEIRRTAAGFIGYGRTRPGDRVLLAADTHFDPEVVEATAKAFRERGARVDVIVTDAGPDREFDDLDELRAAIRRRPWREEPRRWEGIPWVQELAAREGYDLLVHGKGGGIPPTKHRYEAFPWLRKEHFASRATVFPRDLHTLVNERAWRPIWEEGPGGRMHLTDPEGTEVTWDMWPEYFDHPSAMFGPVPRWNHLMSHPPTPISERESASGTVRGTTNHFGRPFVPITVTVEKGRVEHVEGGGVYGDAWRELLAEARDITYPCFPRPGLFWLWEIAIGTNPKIVRASNIRYLSSGGFEWERRRSGIVHLGMGTQWRGPEEKWAGENHLVYGHLHVHCMAATLVLETAKGKSYTILDKGRLTSLDDGEVRDCAAKYGDPDRVLAEDWVPPIPGITVPGAYEDYAKDPAGFIYSR